jgi:phosphatidylserine synthase
VGVPCPIAATIVSQYMLFSRASFGNDGNSWIMAAIIVALAGLMLSDVPYWKSSTLMPQNFTKFAYGTGTVVTLAGCAVFPHQSLFVGVGLSIIATSVRRAWALILPKAHESAIA